MDPVEAHVIQLVRDFSQAMDSALRENKDEFTCPYLVVSREVRNLGL